MNLVIIGIGGIFGSLCRFVLGRYISQKSRAALPLGTFVINISGALLLGALTRINPENNIYLLLGDGFLGAYTTFSTFMYEGFGLFRDNARLNALIYIAGTLLLGIIGFVSGAEIVKLLNII